MAAPYATQEVQKIPVKIVGGNNFGRYSKISVEETFNMIVSDNALVDYAGYKRVVTIAPTGRGRGIYSSSRASIIIEVIGSQVYKISNALTATLIGTIATSTGEVSIAENNGGQIAITDKVNIYVYNYQLNTFEVSGVDFTFSYSFTFSPGYISFQNGRFIVAALGTTNWVLSAFNDGTVWPNDAQHIGELQTKPDSVQAVVPMPGGGNVAFVFGKNVTEKWTDIGAALFPYQKASTFNIDYGCINATTIAELENMIVWLAVNEQSGVVVMTCNGGAIKQISTDGIDFKLSQLTAPQNCSAFLFKQDGHLIYQFTFIADNLTYLYDFNTGLFFTATDEDNDYHIARKVVLFNNRYYFTSINGGNLYAMGTQYTNYEYAPDDIKQIPRVRVTAPFRLPDSAAYIARKLTFTIENGQPNTYTEYEYDVIGDELLLATEGGIDITTEGDALITTEQSSDNAINVITLSQAAIDLSISRDGGETFGTSYRYNMQRTGKRRSILNYQRLGRANDASMQLKFIGFERFVCFDGELEIYR